MPESDAGVGCSVEEVPCAIVGVLDHRHDGVDLQCYHPVLMEGKLTAGTADNIPRIIAEIVLVVCAHIHQIQNSFFFFEKTDSEFSVGDVTFL